MAFHTRLSNLCKELCKLSVNHSNILHRNITYHQKPRFRAPDWHIKKERVVYNDGITLENNEFINDVIQERLKKTATENNNTTYENSPLKNEIVDYGEWSPNVRRTGVIARNIGQYPMWSTDGRRIMSTLLQVADNHVVKYMSPEEWDPPRKRAKPIRKKLGCLIVGAETIDPSIITKDYYGIFQKAGVLPKRNLCQFAVSPQAALPPGTPLLATHFRVGDILDIRGKTVDHGFQGVMKKWGFKGMPASHGVTKTHRRPGNIGGGGEKGRVWPGTKLPGHMGNKWRVLRGVKILRINTKYNILWVEGRSVPGPVNGLCYLYDTVLPLRKLTSAPPFPTQSVASEIPEENALENIHIFSSPSITFPE